MGRQSNEQRHNSIEREKRLLIGMIVSDRVLAGVAELNHPDLFETRYARTVAGWCLEHYRNYGKAPGLHIQDILNSQVDSGFDKDEAALIERLLANISDEYERSDEYNAEYLLDKAKRRITERLLSVLVENLQAAIDSGDLQEAKRLVNEFEPQTLGVGPDAQGFTAEELQRLDIKEIEWVIDGVIPSGLTLFAGKPKVGKSFFILNAAVSLAAGSEAFGSIPTERASVLYLALEDPPERLKDRLHKILPDEQGPPNLHLRPSGSWPRAHQGGLKRLTSWLEKHPDAKLVIIDTFERFRKPQKKPGYFYTEDYHALASLQELAGRYGIAVVVIHHTKKSATVDPFDEITGTTGLQAAPDTMAKLSIATTGSSGREYALRGRDVDETELAFDFDEYRYVLKGEAAKFRQSEQRQIIIDYLEKANKPVARKTIVNDLEGMVGKGIDTLLRKLVVEGDIDKADYGKYARRKHVDHRVTERMRQRKAERTKRGGGAKPLKRVV